MTSTILERRDYTALLSRIQPRFARRICATSAWYAPPIEVRCFTDSCSGSSILHDLVLATQASKVDALGRIWIDAPNARDLSQTYQVSTAHIARMLSNAQRLDLIGWAGASRRGDCCLSHFTKPALTLACKIKVYPAPVIIGQDMRGPALGSRRYANFLMRIFVPASSA